MTINAAGGQILTTGDTAYTLTLAPEGENDIKGEINIKANEAEPGLTINVTKNLTLQSGKTLSVEKGHTLKLAANVTLKVGATENIIVYDTGTISGTNATSKVSFIAGAKYQQGSAAVRFNDGVNEFTTTDQKTVAAASDTAGENKLRAGDYIWNGTKFVKGAVTLAAGSYGTADDGKITGLTAGKKYIIKAGGGNWQKVIAAGTTAASDDPASNDAGILEAAHVTEELTGTEITGLTNDTSYYLYEVIAAMPNPGSGAPLFSPLRGPIPGSNVLYTIKNSIDGAGLDLTGTAANTASNISLTITGGGENKKFVKIAQGAENQAKVSIFIIKYDIKSPKLNAPNYGGGVAMEDLLQELIGEGKLIAGDSFKIDSGTKLSAINKNTSSAPASLNIGSEYDSLIFADLKIVGGSEAACALTIAGALGTNVFKPQSGYIVFDVSGARQITLDNNSSGNITIKSTGGRITIPATSTAVVTLDPNDVNSITDGIQADAGTLAIASEKTFTLAANKSLMVAAAGSLVLNGTGKIAGADNTAKVSFTAGAKYQQGDTTVCFCDVAADFDITSQITIDAAGDGPVTNDKLRAGDYLWDNVNSKFIRAETCFAAGTKVLMANGTLKSIENITAGDSVLSYDFTGNRETASSVFKTMSREASGYYRLNDLMVTGEHPFAVGLDQWRKVKEIKTGDELIGRGNNVVVQSNLPVNEKIMVYNISVTGTKNYYVFDGNNYYLVHNK